MRANQPTVSSRRPNIPNFFGRSAGIHPRFHALAFPDSCTQCTSTPTPHKAGATRPARGHGPSAGPYTVSLRSDRHLRSIQATEWMWTRVGDGWCGDAARVRVMTDAPEQHNVIDEMHPLEAEVLVVTGKLQEDLQTTLAALIF